MQLDVLLVPIDFSTDANEALVCAIELARQTGGRVHVLHAVHVDTTWEAEYLAGITEEFRAQVRDAAARKLEKALHTVAEAGLAGETHLSDLAPVEAIVETASRIGADLIVMGTHGRSGLQHVLLGSVAERTVRSAPCPVLTLRSSRKKPEAIRHGRVAG
jgi:nucleotide-binding universal stress UspA family protein